MSKWKDFIFGVALALVAIASFFTVGAIIHRVSHPAAPSAGRITIGEYDSHIPNRVREVSWKHGEFKEIWFMDGERSEVDVDEDIQFLLKPGEFVLATKDGYELGLSRFSVSDEDAVRADKLEGSQR